MVAKSIRPIPLFLMITGLLSFLSGIPDSQARAEVPSNITGSLFTQPVDPTGALLLSSRRDPDGSNHDQYVWDNFTLAAAGAIIRIEWIGGYDPLRLGGGGPVIDFRISIYPSIPAGTEPAVAYPPLVEYSTGDNAGQSNYGIVGTIPMYSYAYDLPAPFLVSAGEKYWVHIEALQQGSIPDWGFSTAIGGNGSHYVRESGAGGDNRYHPAPGDAAFSLLGPISDTPTPSIYLAYIVNGGN